MATTLTTDVVEYLRPTTLVEVIYDLEPYTKRYGGLRALLNAATTQLIYNAGEAEARTMLAEKGLVIVSSLTVQAKGE